MTDEASPTQPPPSPRPPTPASWPVPLHGAPPPGPPPPPFDPRPSGPGFDPWQPGVPFEPGWAPQAAPLQQSSPRRRTLTLLALAAGLVTVAIVAGSLAWSGRGAPQGTPAAAAIATATPSASFDPSASAGSARTVVRIGVTLPISSTYSDAAGATRDGVLLAVRDVQVPGVTIETDVRDDAVNGDENSQRAQLDMGGFVADERVVAVVGPQSSSAAARQIPVSSQAGLLQCSPSAQWYGLTQGGDKEAPRGSFIRVTAPDVDQGHALATYAIRSLRARLVFVVSPDNEPDSDPETEAAITKRFTERYVELGGTTSTVPNTVASLESNLRTAVPLKPDAVFYAGGVTGAVRLRQAMNRVGLTKTPMLVTQAVAYNSDSTPSFLDTVGTGANATYAAVSYTYDVPDYAAFSSRFKSVYGSEPEGYALEAYACTQVILEAIRLAAADGGIVSRASVLDAVTKPWFGTDTVLGRLSFTQSGDMLPANITIYEADAAGKDWTYAAQIPVETP